MYWFGCAYLPDVICTVGQVRQVMRRPQAPLQRNSTAADACILMRLPQGPPHKTHIQGTSVCSHSDASRVHLGLARCNCLSKQTTLFRHHTWKNSSQTAVTHIVSNTWRESNRDKLPHNSTNLSINVDTHSKIRAMHRCIIAAST